MKAAGFGLDALLDQVVDRLRAEVAGAVRAELQRERETLATLEAGQFAGRDALSVAETAQVLGCSASMVRFWIKVGELVPLDLSGDRLLIGRDQIRDLLSAAARKRRRLGEAPR